MKLGEFRSLIAKGESENLEFKLTTPSIDRLARIICAFLNRGGGRIVIGVDDAGKLIGLPDAEGVVKRIGNQLPSLITPKALWTIENINADGQDFVHIKVPEGMDKPYVTEGGIYLYNGHRTLAATRDEISELIKKSIGASNRWERQVAVGAERSDLDDSLIQETMKLATESERWYGSQNDIDTFLRALGLLINGEVTNAALLLYGKQPSRLLPQARVRLLVMPEGKTGDHYSLDKMFDSCLLRVAQDIPKTLASYVGGVGSSFVSNNWQRSEQTRYPMTALREGIMNAIVHRNYESNSSIIISIQPDSFKISNPGGLPDELKLTDLKRNHPSVPRNPDIAHICFLHRLIEKIGRGTQRIIKDCREAKLVAPKWSSSPLETSLTLFSSQGKKDQHELNARQTRILEILKSNKALKASEVVALLNESVSSRTIGSDLGYLVECQLVTRLGKGPGTTYILVGNDLKE